MKTLPPLLSSICPVCQLSLDGFQVEVEAAKGVNSNTEDTEGTEGTEGTEDVSKLIKRLYGPQRLCCRANSLGKHLEFSDFCNSIYGRYRTTQYPMPSQVAELWRQSKMASIFLDVPTGLLACLSDNVISIGNTGYTTNLLELKFKAFKIETNAGTYCARFIGSAVLTEANGKTRVTGVSLIRVPIPSKDGLFLINGGYKALTMTSELVPNMTVVTKTNLQTKISLMSSRNELPKPCKTSRKFMQIILSKDGMAKIPVRVQEKKVSVPLVQFLLHYFSGDGENFKLLIEQLMLKEIKEIHHLSVDVREAVQDFIAINCEAAARQIPDEMLDNVLIHLPRTAKFKQLISMIAKGFLVHHGLKKEDSRAVFLSVQGIHSNLLSEIILALRKAFFSVVRVNEGCASFTDKVQKLKINKDKKTVWSRVSKSPRFSFLLAGKRTCSVCGYRGAVRVQNKISKKMCASCHAPKKKGEYECDVLPPTMSSSKFVLASMLRVGADTASAALSTALIIGSSRKCPLSMGQRKHVMKHTDDPAAASLFERNIHSSSLCPEQRRSHVCDFGFVYEGDGTDNNPHEKGFLSVGAFLSTYVPTKLLAKLVAPLRESSFVRRDLVDLDSEYLEVSEDLEDSELVISVNGCRSLSCDRKDIFEVKKLFEYKRRSIEATPREREQLMNVSLILTRNRIDIISSPDRLLRPIWTQAYAGETTWIELLSSGCVSYISQLEQVTAHISPNSWPREIMDELLFSYRALKICHMGHIARGHFTYRMASSAALGGFSYKTGQALYYSPDAMAGVLGNDRYQLADGAYAQSLKVTVVATAGRNIEDAAVLSLDSERAPQVAYADKIVVLLLRSKNGFPIVVHKDQLRYKYDHLAPNGICRTGTEVDSATTLCFLDNGKEDGKGEFSEFRGSKTPGILMKITETDKQIEFIIRVEIRPEDVGNKGGCINQKYTFTRGLRSFHSANCSRYIIMHPQSIGTRQSPALIVEGVRIGHALGMACDNVHPVFRKAKNISSVLSTNICPAQLYLEVASSMSKSNFIFDSVHWAFDDFTGEAFAQLPFNFSYMLNANLKHPKFQITGKNCQEQFSDKAPAQELILYDVEKSGYFDPREASSAVAMSTGSENLVGKDGLSKIQICADHRTYGCSCDPKKRRKITLLTTEQMEDVIIGAEVHHVKVKILETEQKMRPHKYKAIGNPVSMSQIIRSCERKLQRKIGTTKLTLHHKGITITDSMARILGSCIANSAQGYVKSDREPLRDKCSYVLEFFGDALKSLFLRVLTEIRQQIFQLREALREDAALSFERHIDRLYGYVVRSFDLNKVSVPVLNAVLFTARNHVPVRRLFLQKFIVDYPSKTDIAISIPSRKASPFDVWSQLHYSFWHQSITLKNVPLLQDIPLGEIVVSYDANQELLRGCHLKKSALSASPDIDDDLINDLGLETQETISYSNMVIAPGIPGVITESRLACQIREMSFENEGVTPLPVARHSMEGFPVINFEVFDAYKDRASEFLAESCPRNVFDQLSTTSDPRNLRFCDACGACMRRCNSKLFDADTPPAFEFLIKQIVIKDRRSVILKSNERHTLGGAGYSEAESFLNKGLELFSVRIDDMIAIAQDW